MTPPSDEINGREKVVAADYRTAEDGCSGMPRHSVFLPEQVETMR
jgi:hypothetical protein